MAMVHDIGADGTDRVSLLVRYYRNTKVHWYLLKLNFLRKKQHLQKLKKISNQAKKI
jgi:hypothetical protein